VASTFSWRKVLRSEYDGAAGSVLFVVLRTMKKRGLLADQAIIRAGQRADEGVVESPRDHA